MLNCMPERQSVVLLVVFLLVYEYAWRVGASRENPSHYARFFRALGHKIRCYRIERQWTQEDMFSRGFSVRHWQMIEAGRPITLLTLLRICETFDVLPDRLLDGLGQHLRFRKKDGRIEGKM